MSVCGSWLLLLYGLPTAQNTGRVSLWRKLKKFGALPLKTSAYLLPDTPLHFERFQWLAKQVRDAGGEATLIRVTQIEGLTHEEVVRSFNQARSADYAQLIQDLAEFVAQNRKRRGPAYRPELEKLIRRFTEIHEIDYFDCPAAQNALMWLKRAEGLGQPHSRGAPTLDPKDFTKRTWLTRPRPEIDRVGSAWLIRKFIDSQATFVFSPRKAEHPNALPFDMVDVEFTHHGEDCTFETLLKRFNLQEPALKQLAEMIHDADLEDNKFQRVEAIGLDRMLKGLAKLGCSDPEILAKGWEAFDALYATLKNP